MKKRSGEWIAGVAQRLEQTRKALGFKSQKKFSKVIGVEYHTYNKWATEANLPDIFAMVRLKEKFGVTTDWIYSGDHTALPSHIKQKLFDTQPSVLVKNINRETIKRLTKDDN